MDILGMWLLDAFLFLWSFDLSDVWMGSSKRFSKSAGKGWNPQQLAINHCFSMVMKNPYTTWVVLGNHLTLVVRGSRVPDVYMLEIRRDIEPGLLD